MRPLQLTIQAFGPYADKLTLNMEDLGVTGIYAITGETGSGKTTLFDAIVYALYGTGSGEDRPDGKGLRSVSASPELETRVELKFISDGKIYTIERKPEQYRASKRKDGDSVKQQATQKLIMPDNTVYTRTSEIAEKIKEDILGVTKDQFCQIVMIAQGEFRKLLRADTAERTKILQRIFKTERYDELARRVKEKAKLKHNELLTARDQVSFTLKALQVDSGNPLWESLRSLQETRANALFILSAQSLVDQIVELDAEAHQAAEERLKAAEKAREAARSAFEIALQQDQRRRQLQILGETLKRQETQIQVENASLQAAIARQPEMETLSKETTTLNNLIPRYADLDVRLRERAQVEGEFQSASSVIKKAEGEVLRLQAQQAALTEEAKQLRDAPERRQTAADRLNVETNHRDKLKNLENRVKAREQAERKWKQAQAGLQSAESAEKQASEALAGLQAELKALGNTALRLSELQEFKKNLSRQTEEIQGIRNLYDRWTSASKVYGEAQSKYQQAKSNADALRSQADEMRRRYNDNIAGVLAAALKEGEKCPVCGSVHHPEPARLASEDLTREAVELSEKRANAAKEAFDTQAQICAVKKSELESSHRQMVERLPDTLKGDWLRVINARETEIRQQIQENAQAVRTAQRQEELRSRLEQTDIPKAQAVAEQAARQKGKAQADLSAAQSNLDNAVSEEAEAARGVLPADWTSLDLSDAIAENGRAVAAQEENLRRAERDIKRTQAIDETRKELEAALADQKEAIQSKQVALSGFNERIRQLNLQIDALRAELPYPTRAECEGAIRQKEARRKTIEAAIADAQEALNQAQQEKSNIDGQIKALEDALKAAPDIETEVAKADFDAKEAAFQQATKLEKDVHARRVNNINQQRAMKSHADKARQLEDEYRVMNDVSETLNGRIPLETYVQTAYFDRVIDYANMRMEHMSRGQYDLRRRRETIDDPGRRGHVGLDLDVHDYPNGADRPVNSLSGGESFLAALSLALGMSDAIQQNTTAAVKLDTMFVDEGFGSLSDSFLNLVMDELTDTANTGHRLIGIISHVEEVKEGIDRSIEVTKNPGGVSTAIIR